MDDDGIMLQIYDNIGDELKAKNKLLEKEKEKVLDIFDICYLLQAEQRSLNINIASLSHLFVLSQLYSNKVTFILHV